MSRPLGFNHGYAPLGENVQTPSPESGNGTGEDVTQGTRTQQTRATNLPAGYKRTEAGVIPDDWGLHDLRDGVSLLSGHHVMARDCNDRGVGLPYLTGPTDFSDGRIKHTKFTTKPTTLCRAGDILVTVKGSGSGTLVEADAEYCISRQLMAIRTSAWDPTFLRYSLLQHASRIKAASTGLIPGLSRSDVLDQYIPIPNGATEQRAIAAVLTDVDDLVGSLEALIEKKRAIKRAAMQQLLTGSTRLPGFSGEWRTRRLGECVRIRGDRVSSSKASDDTLCVELEDIEQATGRLLNRELARSVSAAKYVFESGDVLFGRLRPYLRKWWYADRHGVCSTEIWPLVSDPLKADNRFIYWLIQADTLYEAAQVSYGTHMPRADWKVVSEVPLPLPPLAEQRAVATVLTDMDDEIAALERRLDKTRAVKQGMMQQLLTGSIRLPIPDDGLEGESHDA